MTNYYPSIDTVKRLSSQGNLIPIYTEINVDLETPVSAYLKVARPPYSFLLESVEGGEQVARYSFIGTEPVEVTRTGPGQRDGEVDPLILVQKLIDSYNLVPLPELERFSCGMVGYIAYDAVKYFEKLPTPETDTLGVPESVFMMTTTMLVFDHVKHQIRVISHVDLEQGNVEEAYEEATGRIDEIINRLNSTLAPLPPHPQPSDSINVTSNIKRADYYKIVERCKEYVYAGDIIQTVPSQRFSRETSAQPIDIYRALRTINPSPYMYFLHLDDFHIVGASPELLVRVEDGQVSTRPIAGTRPRGKTVEQDDDLEKELLADEKERAEHIMLVDLGRNDVGRVSTPGTVEVTDLMNVERYSHVMHIVSHVVGELREGYTAYDALRACFPAGTLSGAPKIRAMEIIAEMEPDRRGPYGGAVGYFDLKGNMDTAITIRTLVIKDGRAHAQAGGGIVADSVAVTEYDETVHKASAVLNAIEVAEGTS